jgi:hypothetical protein
MSLKFSWSIGASLSFLSLPGCVASADAAGDGTTAPEVAGLSPGLHPASATLASPRQQQPFWPQDVHAVGDLAAWTSAGDLVVVDGHTGALRQTLTALQLGGRRDLAYDAVEGRLWAAETDVDAPDGEVASYAVTNGAGGPQVGGRVFAAATAGEARLLPTALGPVLFEDAGAGAWRLLGAGAASGAVSGPRPAAAWATTGAAGTSVHGLVYGPSSGELDVAAATLGPGVGVVFGAALGPDAGTLPACARVVPAPARGGALLLDVSGAFLTVRTLNGAAVGAPAHVPLGAVGLRLEAAVALSGGAVVVALLSGATEVLALEIDAQLAITSMAKVALGGLTAPATPFFSHDLVVQGLDRVAAATSGGVFSMWVTTSPIGVHLAVDGAFAGSALRGPLAALW